MDIEKLATNEEMSNKIVSEILDENNAKGITSKGFLLDESDVLLFQKELNAKEETEILDENNAKGITSKGFLLDESDILLFQKELNAKEESNPTSVLSENKNLLAEENLLAKELKKTLNENKHDLPINRQIGGKITQENSNNQDTPTKIFSKKKESLIENPVDKKNSSIEKTFNQTTNSEIKKLNDKDQVYSSENPIDSIDKNIFVSGEHLVRNHQDKVLNLTNKSENIKVNDTNYEIKAMPIEISIDRAVNIQTPSTVENVVRTHAEIISQQIKDQIIDRILVSSNDLELNKTVKIVINPSLLENTQVNFQKIGQTLSIQFETINASSLQFLKANQVDLQLYLQENLKQFQDVSVRVKGSSQGFEQPQDGRSRNRYEYENLDDEEQ